MKSKFTITTLAVLLALGTAITPFAADSTDRAQEAKKKMDATRAEVAKIRHQVGLTLEELNRMQKENVQLREQFQKYGAELTKMEEQAKIARDRAFSMEEKGQAFFRSWEDQINSISNPEIREQAAKRFVKRAKSYSKILEAMLDARDELRPFMSDLNDVKKLLDSELTRATVNSAKNLIKQANLSGNDVIHGLQLVEMELDRVSAELSRYE